MKKYLWFHGFIKTEQIEIEEVLEETKTLYKTKTRKVKKDTVKCVQIEDEETFLSNIEEVNKAFAEAHSLADYIGRNAKDLALIHLPTIEKYNARVFQTKEMLKFLRDNNIKSYWGIK